MLMKKILVIQTAFIGDVILATSILEKLHQHYPETQIDFLLRKGNESLFTEHPYISKLYVWDKKGGKIANQIKIIKEIRKEKYDIAINIQRFFSSGLFTVFSKAQQKIGFDKNPLSIFFTKKIKHIIENNKKSLHEIERNHLLIKHITNELISKPKLYPTKKDFETVSFSKKNHYICLAPASVWFTKQYPVEKWIDLVNQLPNDCNFYLLGSKNDFDLCQSIIKGLKQEKQDKVENLSGKLTFLQSAALMQNAIMNYVNDSGPLHIASAVDANVTAVFCSTVPAFGFGPLSTKSYIVEINEKLDCRPCGLHGYKQCPNKHYNCANKIETKQLLDTLERK